MTKKFNHLHVPDHWQQYWSRYPQGYTILEALINWVSQVDSMVDNQNDLNKNISDYRKEMDKTYSDFRSELDSFIRRFDPRLQDEVRKTLTDWQESGFLNIVLDKALQTQVDKVDEKLNLRNWELQNKIRQKKPLVSFVDDDGKRALVDTFFPLAQRYNFPITAAIITQFSSSPDSNGYIKKDEVIRLKDAGWEIISHTHTHEHLATLSESQQEYQMTRSIEILNSWGIEPKGITYPFRSYNPTTKKLARKHFRYGASGGFGSNGTPLETYNIRTVKAGSNFDAFGASPYPTDSLDYLKWRLDNAINNNEWIVFATHAGDTTSDQWQIMEQLIIYIKQRNIEIVTMNEGINRVGNIVDVGEYWKTEPYKDHLVIGYDGKISSNYSIDHNAGEVSDVGLLKPKDFELGKVQFYRVRTNNFSGFPGEQLGGTLIVYALYDSRDYMFQEFHPVNRNTIWKRARRTDEEWRDWEQFTPGSSGGGGTIAVLPKDKVTVNTSLTSGDFEKGKITYCEIASGPSGTAGTLITNRLGEANSSHYQFFTSGVALFSRGYTGSAWQGWRKYLTETV